MSYIEVEGGGGRKGRERKRLDCAEDEGEDESENGEAADGDRSCMSSVNLKSLNRIDRQARLLNVK